MDDVAIERIQSFEAEALRMHPDGYWLAFSGGKDSTVILDLAKRAGVKFKAVHSLTTVDAPELVWFVKTFDDVTIEKPAKTMWQLIRKKGMPPMRTARYCCQELKECGGEGSLVLTGIRWQESGRRSKREMTGACYKHKKIKRYLHPIIDWKTADVWQYIRERGLRYCSLYDEGFKRVGCVLCPMARNVQKHLERWPKLCAIWERNVKAQFNPDKHPFSSPDEYWHWWIDRDASQTQNPDPVLFEDDPDMAGVEADHA